MRIYKCSGTTTRYMLNCCSQSYTNFLFTLHIFRTLKLKLQFILLIKVAWVISRQMIREDFHNLGQGQGQGKTVMAKVKLKIITIIYNKPQQRKLVPNILIQNVLNRANIRLALNNLNVSFLRQIFVATLRYLLEKDLYLSATDAQKPPIRIFRLIGKHCKNYYNNYSIVDTGFEGKLLQAS